jgi:hypothetical protein
LFVLLVFARQMMKWLLIFFCVVDATVHVKHLFGEGTCMEIVDVRNLTMAEPDTLQYPTNLTNLPDACDIWTIAGCGAAVTAAIAICGPLGPADVACVLAAIAAIPQCGPCLCSSISCPSWCPCEGVFNGETNFTIENGECFEDSTKPLTTFLVNIYA